MALDPLQWWRVRFQQEFFPKPRLAHVNERRRTSEPEHTPFECPHDEPCSGRWECARKQQLAELQVQEG